MADKIWEAVEGEGPLLTAAIHDGHHVRPEVARHLALGDKDRLREEDPYTADWAIVAPTNIVGLRSRFEVDLNRPRDKAVYRKPEDAWGLQVWQGDLPEDIVEESLAEYDGFYREARRIIQKIERDHGCFVVFDLHTYNHRRDGPKGPPADRAKNPEVNVGTGTMDRNRWGPLVDRFLGDLRAFDFAGRRLDVRENVKFRGGHFSRWTHENFAASGCSLAIEFKKFFMDEWTGELYPEEHQLILEALRWTIPGILEDLPKLARG
jgi:N-formylglutamate amidohydrolase